MPQESKSEIAVFGGGCFWCTEAVFQRLKGVRSVTPGYAGSMEDPAEVVHIEFDPHVISYHDLLRVFWETHDPTSKNRQGADVGTQYRSVIFYTSPAQQQEAGAMLLDSYVTEILPLKHFYVAEDYHHNYYNKHKSQPYCQLIINPKLEKLRALFKNKLAA